MNSGGFYGNVGEKFEDIDDNNLTIMESNAELYEDVSTLKENQLTMMESIAELYEKGVATS